MPAQYADFFAASAQAAAALVGLLFVALTVDVGLEREPRAKQFALSETAFISLGGIFIISLLTMLPSGMVLALAVAILLSIVGIADLFRMRRLATHPDQAADISYISGTILLYLFLAGDALWMLMQGTAVWPLNFFCMLLIVLFGLSLIRAWRAIIITKRKPR